MTTTHPYLKKMSNLVDLEAYRAEQTARRGFSGWKKRFEEQFPFDTRFCDLPDYIVAILADPGEESTTVFYELIMDILNLGKVAKFDFLKPADRLKVVDIHLFLSDLVRYEMMERLGWIGDYSNKNRRLIDLVQTFDQSDYSRYNTPPQLSQNHPAFEEFSSRIPREREVLLRQLHSEALMAFRETFT